MKLSTEVLTLPRSVLVLLWLAFALSLFMGFTNDFKDYYMSGTLLLICLIWFQWNRSLSVVGSLFVGALLLSSGFDILVLKSVYEESGASPFVLLKLLSPLFSLCLCFLMLSIGSLDVSIRWGNVGFCLMFLLRFSILMLGGQSLFETQMNRHGTEWIQSVLGFWNRLGMEDIPIAGTLIDNHEVYPLLKSEEMPCGIMNFSFDVRNEVSSTKEVKIYVRECGLHPQALVVMDLLSLELHNSLPYALELRLVAQNEAGDFQTPRNIVVPPSSFVELTDIRIPDKGALVIYSPMIANFGTTLLLSPNSIGLWRVSRNPLLLERQ